MIYLSSPYSDPAAEVREQRFQAACRATAALLRAGDLVFSPIVHSHPLAPFLAERSHAWWMSADERYLRKCDSLYVLTIDGWDRSRGVEMEMRWAAAAKMPTHFYGLEQIEELADLIDPKGA